VKDGFLGAFGNQMLTEEVFLSNMQDSTATLAEKVPLGVDVEHEYAKWVKYLPWAVDRKRRECLEKAN